MQVIVHKNENGKLLITNPTQSDDLDALAESLGIKDYEIKDASILPHDRYFRDAWELENGLVKINMALARNVHMNKIREARDAKLKELDIESLKGLDVQDQKQALRDIPQTFDLSGAKTPDELRNLWPSPLEQFR